jgi:regulator of replication initiation timing
MCQELKAELAAKNDVICRLREKQDVEQRVKSIEEDFSQLKAIIGQKVEENGQLCHKVNDLSQEITRLNQLITLKNEEIF